MRVLVGMKHAECRDCGAVLHVPWADASSDQMALLGWSERLRRGCAECGGPLKPCMVEDCEDCAEFLAAGPVGMIEL